jgi:molybdopterin/thiamine biosynthesis adenylyltransferase
MKKFMVTKVPEFSDGECEYTFPSVDSGGEFYEERTNRNVGWIARQEQELYLKGKTVGIAGCGGMGGLAAKTLVRTGIGTLKIADSEVFDVSNLNRQDACTMRTIGESKVLATAQQLRDVADDMTLIAYSRGITETSVADFVSGCNCIADEIEFWALGSRILLHQIARRAGITVFNCPTVGHRVYLYKFTPDSMPIEEVLDISYEDAWILQTRIQNGTATKKERQIVMDKMLAFAVPEIPEYSLDSGVYSTVTELKRRLLEEGTASIIGTNPPMASGFLCNHILFELLRESNIKRNFVLPPPMPGYLMFDAGMHTCSKVETRWW